MNNHSKTFKIFKSLKPADTIHLCTELKLDIRSYIGHSERAMALTTKVYAWDGMTDEAKQKIYDEFMAGVDKVA